MRNRVRLWLAFIVVLSAILVGAGGSPALTNWPVQAAADGLTETEVSFVGSDGVRLRGTVLSPRPAPGAKADRAPAMVLLAGAGNRGRAAQRAEAEAFTRRGVVTLIYDKRAVGYSLFHRDYSVLADDALAGLRLLKSRDDVDPARLGLWALSEGAFVAPLAASRSADVRFVITVGAVGVTPAVQTTWAYGTFLRHAGVSGSFTRTLQGPAARTVVAAGLFPEANFDPAPAWADVRQPVLSEWGEQDQQSVAGRSSEIIAQTLTANGNSDHTIRFVPEAGHALHATHNGGFDRDTELVPGYGDVEVAWINGGGKADGPTLTGVSPREAAALPDFPPLAWYESPGLQLAVVSLLIVVFISYPITAVVRRLRGRRASEEARFDQSHRIRSMGWLAASGLTTIVGTTLYLLFVLANAANIVGPVVAGRPLPWLLLQLSALATVATTAVTVWTWLRNHRDLSTARRIHLGLLVGAGVLFVPWSIYWGLLLP